MLLTDGRNELEIEFGELEPVRGDVRLAARVSALDFSGRYQSIWIDRDAWAEFVASARAMERSREGVAHVEAMSPDEFELTLAIRDAAGHLTARGFVGRTSYSGSGEHVRGKVGFSLELDPTLLPRIAEELESLIAG